MQRLDEMGQRIAGSAARRLEGRRQLMREILVRFRSRDPRLVLRQARTRLADLGPRCDRAARARWQAAQERLRARAAHLEAVGPHAVLARGYAICLTASDHRAVRSFEDVREGEKVEVILELGGLGCVVEERRERWPASTGRDRAPREGRR
jgi:exodeoxyribonuclease VII large subunit